MTVTKESIQTEVVVKENYLKQWIFTIITNITMLTYGMLGGWISPMTKVLQSDASPTGSPLSDFEISMIASVLCIAAIIGTFIFAFTIDRFGRKTGIILVSVLQLTSWIIKLLAKSTVTLIIARIFCGLASGGCYNVVPIYVKEISDDKIRGTLGALFTLFQTTGFLIMYVMGAYMDYYQVLYIMIAFGVITLLSLLVLPETPDFLMKLQKYDKAKATIANLRGISLDHKYVEEVFTNLQTKLKEYESMPKFNPVTLYRSSVLRRGLFLAWGVLICSALSGNFAVLTYASFILSISGVTLSPDVQAISIPVVMIIGSLISVMCVERFGRKVMLGTTYVIASVSMFSIATIIYVLQHGGTVPPWLSVLCIIVYQCAYAAGISSMPYVVASEMFHFHIRARVLGSLAVCNWFSSFCLLLTYKSISNTFGPSSNFYSYAIINLFGASVSLLLLPETKGKSIEVIHEELKGKLLRLPTRKYLRTGNV